MSDIEAEAAKLDSALDETLFEIMEDDATPQATFDAADRLLKQRLNDKLKAAIGNFQAGALKLVDLVDKLEGVTVGLGNQVPHAGAKAALSKVRKQASDLLRQVHDAQGMRTTHSTTQEAEAPHPDEQMLPPLPVPPGEQPPPLTPLNQTGQILDAPAPIDSTRYEELADEYMRFFAGADFKNADITSIVARNAEMCLRFKPRYQKVGDPLGIPWWFIAGIHMLESSFNFDTHLHNGDLLTARTFRVPANRPTKWNPPNDWEASAQDALSGHGLSAQKDWSLPRALYRWEAYNGFGYRSRNVASPYLWSMSTIYRAGKFVGDGVFNATAVSQQCGAASVLKFLQQKGHLALTLDRMSEGEPAPPPALIEAVKEATLGGRTTIDAVLPADATFEQFLKDNLPGLTHFKASEFLMMGGGGDNSLPPRELWPNVVPLAKVLDALRTKLGSAMVLTSVYRNEAHNAAVGGVQGSQHSRFCAADFQAATGNPQQWATALRQMREGNMFQGGIGLYKSFVHIDTRGWNADWTG
jgi:lysozyme family protein